MFMGESAGPGDPQLVVVADPHTGQPGLGLLAEATLLCPTVSPCQRPASQSSHGGRGMLPSSGFTPEQLIRPLPPVRMRPVCPKGLLQLSQPCAGRSAAGAQRGETFLHRRSGSRESPYLAQSARSCRAAIAHLTAQEFTGSLRGVTAGSSGIPLDSGRAECGGVAPGCGG